MSSICGIVDFGSEVVDFNRLRNMDRSMILRGRDQSGIYINNGVGIGHNRMILSGNDKSRQPYTVVRGDNRYTIAIDGEIYSFGYLAQGVGESGFSSFAEAVLEYYIAFGRDCVKHLDGRFAFVIYDEAHREIFIARDTLGARPLYYFCDGKKFAFASEIKGLLRYFKDGREVPREAVIEKIFALPGAVRGYELYTGISELPEGCAALHTSLGTQVWRYGRSAGDILGGGDMRHSVERISCVSDIVCDEGCGILDEALVAFDHPEFDEYMLGYVESVKSGREKMHISVEDRALRFGMRYSLERADRFGMMNGVIVYPAPAENERKIKHSILVKTEKKLSDKVGKLLSVPNSELSIAFGKDIYERAQGEKDICNRIRIYAKMLQTERWISSYGVILT